MLRSLNEKNYSRSEYIGLSGKFRLPCYQLQSSQLSLGKSFRSDQSLNSIFSVIDLEVVYAAKGQMLEPMKPAVPMQECQFSWRNATVERQDELKSLLSNISTAVRAIISCLSCKFASIHFQERSHIILAI